MYLSTHLVKTKKKYTILQGGEIYMLQAMHRTHTPEANKQLLNGVIVNDSSSLLLFSCSVMSDSATPRATARQASLSFTISQFAQTHVHWIGDAIQPPDSLLSPSPPAFDLSQH